VLRTTSNSVVLHLAWLLVPFLQGTASGTANLQPFEAVEPHMGTLFRIKLYAPNGDEARAAFRSAFARIRELDNELSDYKPESELSRITEIAVHHPTAASTDLFRVLAAAQQISEETAGAFDVTLGPVIRLWRQARKTGQPPSADALREAAKLSGYTKMKLDAARGTVEFTQPGMKLDVGGIAKGYAADEALAVLSAAGIKSALVAASGDLAFSDAPPGKEGWSIGIDSFDDANTPFTTTLMLANAAVSTSGDTEQYLDADGKHYSHIVDPKTGSGLTRRITVTVVARRGMAADPLATAVDIMGPDKGLALIEAQAGAAALIVLRNGKKARVIESRRFGTLAVQPN
jgi:thiamine biosynthesis lipoprotein